MPALGRSPRPGEASRAGGTPGVWTFFEERGRSPPAAAANSQRCRGISRASSRGRTRCDRGPVALRRWRAGRGRTKMSKLQPCRRHAKKLAGGEAQRNHRIGSQETRAPRRGARRPQTYRLMPSRGKFAALKRFHLSLSPRRGAGPRGGVCPVVPLRFTTG